MRVHADVAAHADRHARRPGHAEGLAAEPHRRGCRFDAVPAAIARARVGGGERRAERDPLRRHRREHRGRAAVAVLDRVDPRLDRAPHPLRGRRVDRDRTAGVVRRRHRRLHLVEVQRRTALLAGAPAVVGVELHPVGAGGDLPTDGRDHLLRARHLLGALRDRDARFEPLGAVGAERDDRARRDAEPRALDDALVDRRLQPDVGIARPLGAQVALAGEPGEKRRARAGDRTRGAQRQRLVQHLIVPARLVVGMEEEVAVPLDHPRHQRVAGQVDGARAGGNGEVGADRDDAVAAHQDLPAGVGLAVDAVEHRGRAQQERCRFGRRRRRASQRQCRRDRQPALGHAALPVLGSVHG